MNSKIRSATHDPLRTSTQPLNCFAGACLLTVTAFAGFNPHRAAADTPPPQHSAVHENTSQANTPNEKTSQERVSQKTENQKTEKLPTTVNVGGSSLRKIGSGVRTARFIGVKVYEAALYAAAPDTKALSWDDVQALPKPQQLRLHFVRAVDKGEIEEDLDEGLQAVTDKPESYASQLEQLKKLLGDMNIGSLVELTSNERGLAVAIDNSAKGEIADPAFAREIFATWLSPKAPFPKLQQALLGQR